VDDEPVVAQTLARVLKLHHDVLVAHGGGHEVLDRLARGERYDILLCDLMMPEMTGMELMAAIEDRHPDLAERVLFVTGGAFTAEARAFVERYASRLVEKPFDISVLRQRVAEMTNRA
jgi:CheY-like chemotaxis protein